MTHEEYINAVRKALSELDKTDKEAVHRFNEWRETLYKKYQESMKTKHDS